MKTEEDGAALVETHSAHTRIGSALDRADALLRRLKVHFMHEWMDQVE